MASLRFSLRLTLAYLARFKGIIFFGVILGIVFFFLIRIVSLSFLKGTTERIGGMGRHHTDDLPEKILDLVSDGLTKTGEEGIIEPDLAASWETPDKGKTWIFHLKKGKFWQDGSPITSQSLIYEFSDVSVEKPDESTIIFKLKDPYSPFPAAVSKPSFRKGLLGVGEWKVDKILVAGSFVESITLVNSDKDKKIFKFYPTVERTKLAYKLGEVDSVQDLLHPQPFDTWKNTNQATSSDKSQVIVLFFNTMDPLLSEKALRQALAYAIDKDLFGERAISPISPNSWAFNPQVKEYPYDPKRARELIAEMEDEAKKNLEIKLVSSAHLLPTAEKISKNWEEIGVKTLVQVSSIIPGEFQAYLTILDIPKDPDQYPLWHTTQTETNISKYTSFRIDKLLEDGRSELDPEERRKIYLDFQRFLLEDAPAAFLYHPTYYTISRR